MDALSDKFGSLSTSAREWTPGGVPASSSFDQQSIGRTPSQDLQVDSELNAAAVKEFVPGQGWTQAGGGGGPPAQNAPSQGGVANVNPYTNTGGSYQHQQSGPELHHDDTAFPSTVPSGPLPPPFRSVASLGVSDDLWRQHRQWQMESIRRMEPSDPRHKAIPAPYCNAFDLDYEPSPRSSFGYPCGTYQVTSREDGHTYCLRRFDSVKSVNPTIAGAVMDQWAGLEHPGLCTLHASFVAQRAVFFVHQYIPGVMRLRDRLMAGGNGGRPGGPGAATEPIVWSAVCQWTSVIRRIHQNGLAARTLDARHVLLQMDSMRLRWYVNCVGVVDALEWEARKSLELLQSEDIRQLGRLVLSLATGTEVTANMDATTFSYCERYCAQNFSRELHNLAMTLIRSPTPPTIVDVSRALAGRVWDEWDQTSLSLHRTERALGVEFESGRLLRLLLKLGFVNERPEFGPNRRWSQSGDCYLLTLFRDFVFHQADGAGNPIMDLGHVMTVLNKLDAADEEKIVLSSRDGKSVMVVSYADVARCLHSAYHELCGGSIPPQQSGPY